MMNLPTEIRMFLLKLKMQDIDAFFETVPSLANLEEPLELENVDALALNMLSVKAYHERKTEEFAKTLPYLAKLSGHNEDFLGNMIAFALPLHDDTLVDALKKMLPDPVEQSGVLAFNIACLHAKEKNKKSMLAAVKNALELEKTSDEFFEDEAFNDYHEDEDFLKALGVS